jgi:hypothetical protein
VYGFTPGIIVQPGGRVPVLRVDIVRSSGTSIVNGSQRIRVNCATIESRGVGEITTDGVSNRTGLNCECIVSELVTDWVMFIKFVGLVQKNGFLNPDEVSVDAWVFESYLE